VLVGVNVSVGAEVAVKVTVGGKVSLGVGKGVFEGINVAVGLGRGVNVTVGGNVADGEEVSVQVGVKGKVGEGVTGVAVTNKGVKEGTTAVSAVAVWLAESAHNGVGVGGKGRGPPPRRTSSSPVQ
jgi:hypothetical protein